MDNGTQGEVQSTSNFAPPVTPSPTPQTPSEERTFKQSEVNDIAARRASEAVERYKRESSIASHQQQPTQQQPQYQAPPQQSQFNGMSQDEYRRIAAEEAKRLRDQWVEDTQRSQQEQEGQRIANEFLTKIEAGKGKYDDFEKVVSDVGFAHYPHIVQLANMVDNTDEVIYELAKNPGKIGSIQSLVDIALRNGVPPTLAINEMKKLASSIKENAGARNFKAPNEPLSQLRSGTAGTDNKGALGVSDYKRKYRI